MHRTVTLLMVVAALSRAQAQGTISGFTRDSTSRPLAGVEVVARPGGHRTRSDSSGHFSIKDLDGGSYQVTARKFGYSPANWGVSLNKGGQVEIQLLLAPQPSLLDTLVVTAERKCSVRTLDGFDCRRKVAAGMFLDYTDIDDKEPVYTIDIFRGIKGYRIDTRYSRAGELIQTPVYIRRCMTSFVDGMAASPANPIPTIAQDITAMELYFHPDSVPGEFKRLVSFRAVGQCGLVVYWTTRARTKD